MSDNNFTLHESILIPGKKDGEVDVYLLWKSEVKTHLALGQWGQVIGKTDDPLWAFALGFCEGFKSDCMKSCPAAKSIREYLHYSNGSSLRIHRLAFEDMSIAGLDTALKSFDLAQQGDERQLKINREMFEHMKKRENENANG